MKTIYIKLLIKNSLKLSAIVLLKSLFKYNYNEKSGTFKKTPKLKKEVFTEGNTVQMWKLLDKKGVNWHVSCVIWHNEEPYSFGFDGNFIHETDKIPNGFENSKYLFRSCFGKTK